MTRNKKPVDIGDLVRCTLLGSPEYKKVGLVVDRIYYTQSSEGVSSHPDEYNCQVLFDTGRRMVRAKWLKIIKKVKKT